MSSKKLLSLLSLVIFVLSPVAEASTITDALSSIRATNASLPAGVANPKGSIATVLDTIFNVTGDKIQAQYLDVTGGAGVWTASGTSAYYGNTGNVGIGTSNPGTKLEVNGTATATAFVGNGAGITAINPANISAGTAGIGITGNAATVTNGLYTTGSYADPAWITSLAKSKVGLGSVENTALSTWAGSANITTLGTITSGIVPWARLSGIPNSAAGTSGILSNTDWSTFNAKIGGSGTTSYLPKFTAAGAIGNSIVFDDGTNVGIGNPTPTYKLDVTGSGHLTGNLTVDGTINGVLATSINATNVSAGAFGANTGNGNYTFPGNVGITGTATAGFFSGNGASITAINPTNISAGTAGIGITGSAGYMVSADTRNTNNLPQDRNVGFYTDFKANATDSLSDGGTYHGVMTFRPYGNTTDFTGGSAAQIATTDNSNIWHRSGSSATWGSWVKMWDANNLTNLSQLTNGPGYITASNGVTSLNTRTGAVVITKTDVGLGNVEDTALSTWAGSANITGIGTLTSGTVPVARISGLGSLATVNSVTSAQVSDATNLNTANMVVKRDASGNFAAGTITAALSGNATTATSSPLLSALSNYVWSAATLPTGYSQGIQSSFVQAGNGFQNYGSVMTMNTYSGGGGALQLYVPYSPTYGGTGLQARFGNYDVSGGNSWTAWKTLLASDNYNTYAPTLTGGGASGTWGISISGNAATVGSLAATSFMRSDATNVVANVNYFKWNKGAWSYVGTQSSYGVEAYSDDGGAAGMSFHRGGAYAVNMGLDPDNVLRIWGWSASANRWQLDMSGNETVAGKITVGSGPTANMDVATKQYVDAAVAGAGGALNVYKSDGTTVLGKFLQFVDNWSAGCDRTVYSVNGTITYMASGQCESLNPGNLYYTSGDCTGTAYILQAVAGGIVKNYDKNYPQYGYSCFTGNYASYRRDSDFACIPTSQAAYNTIYNYGGCTSNYDIQMSAGVARTCWAGKCQVK